MKYVWILCLLLLFPSFFSSAQLNLPPNSNSLSDPNYGNPTGTPSQTPTTPTTEQLQWPQQWPITQQQAQQIQQQAQQTQSAQQACSALFQAPLQNGGESYDTCIQDMQACLSGGGTESRCICKVSGGIVLNTDVPFIGNCINLRGTGIQSPDGTTVTPVNAFPTLMQALSKIIMSVIMVVGFLCILIGGVMITTGDPEWWKNLIKHVVIAMALLGASGTILRLINPNFFG